MNEPSTASLAQNVTWTVSKLCEGKPVPELDTVKAFIVPLLALLDFAITASSATDIIRTYIAWALSYLSDGDEDRSQAVMNSEISVLLQ